MVEAIGKVSEERSATDPAVAAALQPPSGGGQRSHVVKLAIEGLPLMPLVVTKK